MLEPTAEGFPELPADQPAGAEHLLVERANMLTLTAPEMTVPVGGLRALGIGVHLKWTAGAVDLVFGSNAQLRAVAEIYGAADAVSALVHDFAAGADVMDLDRFDAA